MKYLSIMIFVHGIFLSLFSCNKQTYSSPRELVVSEPAPYISEDEHKRNKDRLFSMVSVTMKQLRSYGVTDDSQLKIKYFFYTDTEKSAESLAMTLVERGYSCWHGSIPHEDSLFLITGWTTPMQMSDDVVTAWVGGMCDIGYEHNCGFDSWETNHKKY